MTATTAERGRFDMGGVIQRTLQVLGRNFLPFFLLALVLSGIPVAILALFQANQVAALNTGSATPGVAAFGLANALFGLLTALVSIVTSSLLQAAVVTGTISDLNGRKMSLGEMVSAALPLILPLIAISILYGLGLVVGFLLLIVPGLILATVWAVALPAAVTERTGIGGAFSRSADLTRGHRWSIFGLFVLIGLAVIVLTAIIGGILGVLMHSTIVPGQLPTTTPAGIVLNALLRTLGSMVSATLVACLYYELRSIKEGVAPQALAQVFS